MIHPAGPALTLPSVSLIAALASFAALQFAAFQIAGGAFQYPLDDPYIHMAIAEQMRAGGYGVNAGEDAAAASSVLYPALLIPFAGEAAQRFMPLVWNGVGLGLAAYLWGRILWRAGYGDSRVGLLLALAGPIALHMVGLAFTGMEHALHLAASLAIVLGLMRFLDDGRIAPVLLAGVLCAPLLRFEGLALALLAAGLVTLRGRFGAGAGLAALAVGPIVAFSFYLMALGLDPMPSSITAKLSTDQAAGSGLAGMLGARLQGLAERPQQILAGFLLAAVALFAFRGVRASNRGWLLGVVILAGGAHMLVAKFGWMDRYEIYILATVAAGSLVAARVAERPLAVLLPVAAMGGAAIFYTPSLLNHYPYAPRAIELQQAQMARFAKDFLKDPVAVNDLGLVAWRNPDYVLDLWGLANHEARQLRLQGDQGQWPDRLATARGVEFAMVYTRWFPQGLGADWVPLGKLQMQVYGKYLGAHDVQFYLTDPIDPAPYLTLLADWQAGLPTGVVFDFAEGLDG